MREIKFRGIVTYKDATNWSSKYPEGSWVYGGFTRTKQGICYIVKSESSMYWGGMTVNFEAIKVIPETVEQYTGLKDKNGKEIYEGDIIKLDDNYDLLGMNAGEVSEVIFRDGGFRMKAKYNKKAKGHWLEEGDFVEVIGNIYKNPELIK